MTDAWLSTFRKHRKTDWTLFVEAGERFFAGRPVAQIAASLGVVSAAVIALFTALGG
jgi:hypothetical protein